MSLNTFFRIYLKDNAVITIVENDTDIIFEGKVWELCDIDYNEWKISIFDIATRKIVKIEGFGSIEDIIIYIE